MGEVEDNGPALSEDENEMNLINVKSHKRPKILDSDSDSETAKTATKVSEDGPSQQSNEDEDIISHSECENAQKIKRKSKFMILPSDGETSEDEISPHNKSFPDEETAVEAIIYTTNNKGELVPENTTKPIQKSCLSSLWDPESSEDEQEVQKSTPPEYENARVAKPKQQRPPRKAKISKEDKPKKMTPRDAVQQRIEIQSESQRMVRESNVSLPYHKPKSYTLKEFLEKRSKLVNAASIIAKAPPPVAMKMSKDQLEEVSRKVDERIKQVEEFYKSESDEDEEEESEIASKEIRGWLDCLVDNAVDSVENKMDELLTDECEEKMDIQTDKTPDDDQQFSEDYEFNLDDINEPEPPKRPKIADLLKEKLNIQPRLSGCPDDIIDLDEGVTKPSAVKRLVEKFFQHTAKKISHKHKVELNIVGVTGGGEIVKETVSMNVDEEEEPVIVETPGAKLQKLRAELQSQMALKRSELWKQKQEQGDTLLIEKTIDDEGENEKEKDILDDDEEEEIEMTESESDEEMEEAEDYNLKSEKPKSAFLDDEADEDDMKEENEDAGNINEDKEDENEEENDTDENNGFDGDDEEIPDGETSQPSKKKILKRIIKPFTEDSDDDEDGEKPTLIPPNPPKESLNSTATASSEDDIIPPNLPRTDLTPQRHVMAKEKTDFEFLTPVSFLTGLQNLNSTDKFSKESPVISPFRQPFEPSPLKDSKFHKKLFSEQFESSQDSQSNIENLAAAMCSGNFPQSQVEIETHEDKSEEMAPSTQDLLNICSGGFAINDTSNETREATEKVVINIQTNPDNEIKSLDEDNDQIISQLLDEEELERFKKKFESPVTNQLNVSHSFGDAEEVNATGLINSDDENEGLEVKTKKKRQKKLVFSDDEETSEQDEEVEQEDEEEIDLHDTDDEEQLLENEIKAQESGLYRPSDFLDKEAELSESEWGSADEDEKGLDELEFEQGDEETFNENKVRSELERIHMRQVLDDDNREVKLLQELLLEDGEMHGAGRQRQFRWKALDSLDNSGFEKRDDDDIYLDEEDNEEEFRKMRHKREMFLKKKSTEDDVDSILSDSQILKMGQQVFKSSQSSSSQNNTPINKTEVKEKETFSLLSKRGSFLSRNDQVLQRLAEYNKVTESVTGNTAKNSRCFVFQTVETIETVQMKNNNNNKRKASDGTPNAIKKLRLTSNFSPANTSKKQSGKAGGAKKLFGNW